MTTDKQPSFLHLLSFAGTVIFFSAPIVRLIAASVGFVDPWDHKDTALAMICIQFGTIFLVFLRTTGRKP